MRDLYQELYLHPLLHVHHHRLLLDNIRQLQHQDNHLLKPSRSQGPIYRVLVLFQTTSLHLKEEELQQLLQLMQIETRSSRPVKPKSGLRNGSITLQSTGLVTSFQTRQLVFSSMIQPRLFSIQMVTTSTTWKGDPAIVKM